MISIKFIYNFYIGYISVNNLIPYIKIIAVLHTPIHFIYDSNKNKQGQMIQYSPHI